MQGAVQNPAAVHNAAATPHPVASPVADFLALLSLDRMVSPAAGAEHAKPIEKETEHLNVAVKWGASRRILKVWHGVLLVAGISVEHLSIHVRHSVCTGIPAALGSRRNRDVSGQPASFQYTLWCMVLLVVIVTAVGVVLLSSAAQRQREKLTSTTEPATTDKPDNEDDDKDNDYQVAVGATHLQPGFNRFFYRQGLVKTPALALIHTAPEKPSKGKKAPGRPMTNP
ncbi:hypothetical protein MRX96_044539 [Rhipicephalus microplus]